MIDEYDRLLDLLVLFSDRWKLHALPVRYKQ